MPTGKQPPPQWAPSMIRKKRHYALICLLSVYVVTFILLVTVREERPAATRSAAWTLRRDKGLAPVSLKDHREQDGGSGQQPRSDEIPIRKLSTDTELPYYTPSFGFVMRDFARRVLSRHISSSNVLVIAPDATSAAKEGMEARARNQTDNNPYDNADFRSSYSIGGTFLLHAAMEGHDLHAIDFGLDKRGKYTEWGQSLDTWWESFGSEEDGEIAAKSEKRWSSTSSQPRWIIAAIFDHFDPHKLDLVDKIWSMGANHFLTESTMTYVVIAMHSRKVGGSYEYGGLAAAKALLDHRYKLQTLQLSHYHASPGTEGWTEAKYGPNAFLKRLENVQDLLRWGADTLERYSDAKGDEVFTAYIFATQGLDLAIPSRSIFAEDPSKRHEENSTFAINTNKTFGFKACPQSAMEPKLDLSFIEVGCRHHDSCFYMYRVEDPTYRPVPFP